MLEPRAPPPQPSASNALTHPPARHRLKGANDSEIKKNYRRLARSLHPDKNPDKDAKAKFNAVSKAYQVLSNEEERAKYDSYLKDPTVSARPLAVDAPPAALPRHRVTIPVAAALPLSVRTLRAS